MSIAIRNLRSQRVAQVASAAGRSLFRSPAVILGSNRSISDKRKMPTYKLTYFNLTGLGEPIRFMMHYGGIDFEDFRLEYNSEEWFAMKSKMPMEQIPILEIDGKVYHQSRAINRYLAKKLKLYGRDDVEAMEIDMCVDDIEEWRLFYTAYNREQEPTRKAKLLEIANARTPWNLARFEERVRKNAGFFVGGKLTWADITFSAIIELVQNFAKQDFVKDYPALHKIMTDVRSHPRIKAYLDQRPKTWV